MGAGGFRQKIRSRSKFKMRDKIMLEMILVECNVPVNIDLVCLLGSTFDFVEQ